MVLLLVTNTLDLGILNAFFEILGAAYFIVALWKWKRRPPRADVDDFYAHLTPEQRARADELAGDLSPQERRRLDEKILNSCFLCEEPFGNEPTISADDSGNFIVHRRCLTIYDQLRARHFPDNKT